MRNRRLTLSREVLTPLQPDELAAVAGAAYSRPQGTCDPTVAICQELTLANSYCPDMTCGFACTANCTDNCA